MKYKKICPKCGGQDILMIPGSCGAYGSGNNILLGATIFSGVGVHRYICGCCGYSEEYISRRDLEKVARSSKCRQI
ncbi:MAG: hypothetical protein MJ065_07090 [Oscillospiraceae bacterium]|nr:hypothetical protein [Oscillospiraceae bacterium]